MNIVVKTASGHCVVRPDTSWVRKNDDLYLPDFAGPLSFSPIVYAHVSRPGKSIGSRFASRYYDSISYGMLLYARNLLDGSPEGYASAICMGHTSFLPYPLEQDFPAPGAEFILSRDDEVIFKCNFQGRQEIENAIVDATEKALIRTGDFVAAELQEMEFLCDGPAIIKGTLDGRLLMDFRII